MTTFKAKYSKPSKCPRGNTNSRAQTSRKFCYTLFDHESPPRLFWSINSTYSIMGLEFCPDTGRLHWQSFAYFKREITLTAAIKIIQGFFDIKCHVEICRGSIKDNFEYCSKNKIYYESGVLPKGQGARTDLKLVKDDIMSGKKTSDDILLENPEFHHQYGRTLDRIEDLYLRTKFRTTPTTGEWIYGPTGVGKSMKAFTNYTPETHYNVPDDNGWWDNYKGQETVIFNDFRGWLKYEKLLEMVDRYPFDVPRRNRKPIPFTSKHVIITSSLSPEEVYKNRNSEDKIEQLYRRFKITKLGDQEDTVRTTIKRVNTKLLDIFNGD